MKVKYLFKGFIKSVPGIELIYRFNRSTGGTDNSRYCYSVWLRHLILAYQNGLNFIPENVVELGPGDSLGTGFAALISGANKYYAIDVKKYGNAQLNLKIFNELVLLFKQKTPVPNETEFPHIKPRLNDYNFPDYLLTDELLKEALSIERISKIRSEIASLDNPVSTRNENKYIIYLTPSDNEKEIKKGSINMIFSQAVLQHIDDLEITYKNMSQWIEPGGLMSHTIDFKSMGSSGKWYGHWEYSDFEWKIVRGRKKFYINRAPYSIHAHLMKINNFKIICEIKTFSEPINNKRMLAKQFKQLSEEDLSTSNLFIQAKKI